MLFDSLIKICPGVDRGSALEEHAGRMVAAWKLIKQAVNIALRAKKL
jgi:hypothetical protein